MSNYLHQCRECGGIGSPRIGHAATCSQHPDNIGKWPYTMMAGNGEFIRCHQCGEIAWAFVGNRTDGLNGFVCKHHFNHPEECDRSKFPPEINGGVYCGGQG